MVTAGYCPRISSIRFHLLGEDDIQANSTVNVKSYDTFITNDNPVPGGLYDPRMGAIVNLYNCVTCGHNHHKCPGHFGYYKTNTPLLQPIALENVTKWLKIICLKCGNLLIDPLKLKDKPSKQKLQFAATLQTANKICSVCEEKHPKIKNSDDNIFYVNLVKSDGSIEIMKPQDIWQVLQKISNETCEKLGISIDSHPRKYYTENIFIPPITIRPNFKSGLVNKSHRASPLIEFARGIIRKGNIKGTPEAMDKAHLFMARAYYDMIRGGSQKKGELRTQNIIGGSTNDAILKSIGGKKGRIRNYLMGRRGFNCARITISCNSTLKIDELGIPDYVVNTLLISETVRDYNKEKLWNFLQDGKCTKIKKISSGKEHTINYTDISNTTLNDGDIIYRHIAKEDYVNFNRQPSLKESAIGSHRAVPFETDEQNTFQINVGACVNYNADFDGDQMRARVLTSSRSIAEARYVTSVPRWMLSQQMASGSNAQVQDAIVGSALLTHSDVKMDKLHVMRAFSRTGIVDINFDKEIYTGREILSLLLKRTPITYKGKANFYKEAYKDYIPYKKEDTHVIIENGIIKSGIIDKSTIGEGIPGGIFHLIALEYGTKKALEVIYQYQQIIMEYLYMRGMTMGLDNLIVSKEVRSTVDRIISDKIVESKAYADKLVRGQIFPPMGTTLEDYYEETQLKILSFGDDILGPIISSIDQKDNGLFNMIIYGSKGKPTHLTEMMAVRGSVTLEGKRMPQIFSPWRCSAYFARFDMDPISRGYVRDPLTEGFNPDTMGYSAQSARQMIVQKSQSTALTGANQRKHIKNMESTITNNLYQVDKSQMKLQFLYGEDGFDPRYLIKQKLDSIFMNDATLKTAIVSPSLSTSNQKLEFDVMKKERDYFRKTMSTLTVIGLQYKGYSDYIPFGIYVDSIIDEYFEEEAVKTDSLDDKFKIVKDYIDNIAYFYTNDRQKELKTPLPEFISSSVKCLQILLRNKLSSTKLIYIKKESITPMLLNISIKLKRSLIPAGSCVGCQAAQGVGEPMTQSMLDAVHGRSAGARAGLESIKEILGRKYAIPESNSMTIRFKDYAIKNKTMISEIANYIKRVKLIDIYKTWQILLEDLGDPVYPAFVHEKDIINQFIKTHPIDNKVELSRWVVRMELNRKTLIYKAISMEHIVETVYSVLPNTYIVYTTEQDRNVIIRIYLKEKMFMRESNVELFVNNLLHKILDINVRGLSNILDTTVTPYVLHTPTADGGLEKQEGFAIKTVGQDLRGLVSLDKKYLEDIDMDNISLGTVMDTKDLYGIEASRIRIVDQIMERLEGKHPDYHHLSIFADTITWSGDVKSIEKAVNYERNKVLSKASGYAARQVLSEATLNGITESTDNIPAPITLGTIPRYGTNYNNYLLNEEFINENKVNTLDILLEDE